MLAFVLSSTAYAKNTHSTIDTVPQIEYAEDGDFPLTVGTKMQYIEDAEHALSVEDVLSETDHIVLPWREIKKASPNFGFTDSAYWFRFDVINRDESQREVYVELPIPFLDKINAYQISAQKVVRKHYVGDERPFQDRPITHQNFVMPFELTPGANRFVLRIESAGTIEAPLSIWSPRSFLVADGVERLLQGIWFGAMGIMVIYNLFLLALLRDVSYFHYVSFAFSYLMFQASLKGYGFAFLWSDQITWNSFSIAAFIASSNFFAVKLVIRFLDLEKYNRRAFKLASIYAATCGLLLFLSFVLPYSITVRLNSAFALITCVISLGLGYWSWYHSNPMAKYFCLAWTSAFAGVAILVAAKFGFVPDIFWTSHAGQIGVLAQVALLSFALASRFDREKEMRLRAQESALEHERLARHTQDELLQERAEANAKLEHQVTERTENLQTTLSELEEVNKKLEVMSTTDALTELFNRRHFGTCYAEEFKRSLRHKHTLSVILCDVDHFKRINDQYGHQAGDKSLQAIARLLKKRICRSGDLIARYGGEEFIILLSDTSMSQAREIAEELRATVEKLDLHFNDKQVALTASFGVASLRTEDPQSADQLIKQADVALYHAKNSGRNKVACQHQNLSTSLPNHVQNRANG